MTEPDEHLRMRLEGLTRAVGEMEPGEREFCLAAIDEWLDAFNVVRGERDRLREALEHILTIDTSEPAPVFADDAANNPPVGLTAEEAVSYIHACAREALGIRGNADSRTETT